MRRSSLGRTVVSALLLAATATLGHAQSGVTRITVNVPFEFTLGDQDLSPGAYHIERRADVPTLTFHSADAKRTAAVAVITRLARLAGTEKTSTSRLVFDKLRGKSYLSEIWFPGQDGYLVRTTPEEHQHEVQSSVAP